MPDIDPLDEFDGAYARAHHAVWEVRDRAAQNLEPLGSHVRDLGTEYVASLIGADMDYRTGLVFSGPIALGIAEFIRDDRAQRAVHEIDEEFHTRATCKFCQRDQYEIDAIAHLFTHGLEA